ncbi:MAG TPA: DinB family protein, partial [Acidimicrobiia bacterium]
GNRPKLPGYDQDLWVAKIHPSDESPDQLLALWRPLREANIRLWQRSRSEDRARVGIHEERGPESYDLTFRMLAGHDRFHLDQMSRTIAAIRGQSES